jgi:hypothetical protein
MTKNSEAIREFVTGLLHFARNDGTEQPFLLAKKMTGCE